jgi:hypothetical protein
MNYFPGLALNHDPSDFSWDYRHVPLVAFSLGSIEFVDALNVLPFLV